MRTLFIADLHLSSNRPDITQAFNHFLDTELVDVEALYILGDLFEVWVGDDIAEPFAIELADKLKQISLSLPIYFIHGNRDFLVNDEYAKRSGMTLLPEVQLIDLYGVPTVLLHGDSLCTLDKKYQRFRRFRNLNWAKWIYAHLPVKKRQSIADNIRAKSKQGNSEKSYQIMDVEADAVTALMAQTGATNMIHGHTHRPNIHQLGDNQQRIVLGDWYQQTSILSVSQTDIQLDAGAFNNPKSN